MKFFFRFIFYFAFPDSNYSPILFFQFFIIFKIPFFCIIYLFYPPFSSCLRDHKVFASFVAVPETAIDKQDGFVFWEDQVGLAGQLFVVQAVTEPLGKKILPHQHLRLGIFRADAAHVVGPGLGVVDVGHL